MDDPPRRGVRSRPRWTIGFLMIAVAGAALAALLARPFMAPAPKSGEVIGIDFTVHETRLPDGRMATGLAPRVIITRPAAAPAPTP